jgi:hypothetical protein
LDFIKNVQSLLEEADCGNQSNQLSLYSYLKQYIMTNNMGLRIMMCKLVLLFRTFNPELFVKLIVNEHTNLNLMLYGTSSRETILLAFVELLVRGVSPPAPHHEKSYIAPHHEKSYIAPHHEKSYIAPHHEKSYITPHDEKSYITPHSNGSTSPAPHDAIGSSPTPDTDSNGNDGLDSQAPQHNSQLATDNGLGGWGGHPPLEPIEYIDNGINNLHIMMRDAGKTFFVKGYKLGFINAKLPVFFVDGRDDDKADATITGLGSFCQSATITKKFILIDDMDNLNDDMQNRICVLMNRHKNSCRFIAMASNVTAVIPRCRNEFVITIDIPLTVEQVIMRVNCITNHANLTNHLTTAEFDDLIRINRCRVSETISCIKYHTMVHASPYITSSIIGSQFQFSEFVNDLLTAALECHMELAFNIIQMKIDNGISFQDLLHRIIEYINYMADTDDGTTTKVSLNESFTNHKISKFNILRILVNYDVLTNTKWETRLTPYLMVMDISNIVINGV